MPTIMFLRGLTLLAAARAYGARRHAGSLSVTPIRVELSPTQRSVAHDGPQ
jgi:hypothetical protein